ncbi:MAG: DDE-type integrase/transposase/recombinase [Candidatus Margulisbacteria bacterium]|nr:DDE-type integrase/transposase/recombinase [Candidatus Margulisiibacteriota bacterium]
MLTESKDKTIERERIKRYKYFIREYELIKKKKHPKFKFVTDFYNLHGLKRQTFIKYYNRYKQTLEEYSLAPQRRGPKWKTRRPIPFIEQKVIELREKGNNRYEIYSILKPKLKNSTPSPSGIYHIFKRHQINRLKPKMKQAKRIIIKEKAGELGHIDCHYLTPGLLKEVNIRYYLVCIIDDCTRIAWAEVVEDLKSITVMFATLKCLNLINERYNIRFERVLTDNGAEFGGGPNKKNKDDNPFERLLKEMQIKHSFTRPYRPQTNGKVERF